MDLTHDDNKDPDDNYDVADLDYNALQFGFYPDDVIEPMQGSEAGDCQWIDIPESGIRSLTFMDDGKSIRSMQIDMDGQQMQFGVSPNKHEYRKFNKSTYAVNGKTVIWIQGKSGG